MKTLNIASPVAQRLAQITLFQSIQSKFNLHPGKMAKDIKAFAHGKGVKNAGSLVPQLHLDCREIFLYNISEAIRILEDKSFPRTVALPHDYFRITKYFDIDPAVLAEAISISAKDEGLNAVEMLRYLLEIIPNILLWAFSETVKIIDGKKAL